MQLSLTMLAIALLTASFMWPAEDAVNGGGLQLVILWMVLGLIHNLRCWRASTDESDAESRRASFNLIDAGVLLIVVGHITSTLYVFQIEGDRRAALNLTFEWAGLFVAWRLLRALTSDRLHAIQICQAAIAIGVGLSAYGIWQHHVFYPQQAVWYQNQRGELDQALSQPDGSGIMRVAEIVARFQSEGIPLDGAERILWENRLLSSSEPFATFSLANTLAGILATVLVLLIGQTSTVWTSGQRTRGWQFAILLIQVALLAYCLVLTKSRSAWAGAMGGLLIIAIVQLRTTAARRIFQWGLAGVTAIVFVAGAAAYFGALDKEVILESPRSLQFRLFYWTGALKAMREQPFWGAGPGNFRQVYLEHKADESSEEILDPHNFILEAWSAGGLVGLSGLLILIGSSLRRLTSASAEVHAQVSLMTVPKRAGRIVPCGMLLGFAAHWGWQWINGQIFLSDFGPRLLLLTGIIPLAAHKSNRWKPLNRTACLAASASMMVHLLAAGGFEMPAVFLMLLACVALGVGEDSPGRSVAHGKFLSGEFQSLFAAAVCLGLAVIVLKLGLIPVSTTDRLILQGDALMHHQHNPRAALSCYLQAADSDPLAVKPRQRIAELETYRLREAVSTFEAPEQTGDAVEPQGGLILKNLFSKALESCQMLISTDRRSSFAYRMQVDCLVMGAEIQKDDKLLQKAMQLQKSVVEMYPSSVEEWFELYRVCKLSSPGFGDAYVRSAAERTLQLERINRQWGHRDRYLSDAQLKMLKLNSDED